MNKLSLILFQIFLVLILFTDYSYSGIVMEQTRYELKTPDKKDKGILLIQDNKMLFTDTTNNVSTLFDFDRDQMIVLDHNGQTFTVIDPKAFVKAIEDYTKEVKRLRQKHLESLPPEQREMVEKMIKKRELESGKNGTGKIVISIKNSGVSENISGYKASKYEVFHNDKLNEELWLTNDLNIQKELDLKKMSNLMTEFKKVNKRLGNDNMVNEDAFINLFANGGFPLKTVDRSFGETVYIEEVVDIRKEDIPADNFKLPSGYKEKSVNELLKGAF